MKNKFIKIITYFIFLIICTISLIRYAEKHEIINKYKMSIYKLKEEENYKINIKQDTTSILYAKNGIYVYYNGAYLINDTVNNKQYYITKDNVIDITENKVNDFLTILSFYNTDNITYAKVKITTEDYNNIKCYKIENKSDNFIIYVNCENMFPVASKLLDDNIETEIEIGNILDEEINIENLVEKI